MGAPVQKGQEPSISVIAVTPHFNSTSWGWGFWKDAISRTRKGGRILRWPIINHRMKTQFWPTSNRDRPALPSRWTERRLVHVIGVTPDINLYGVNPGNEQAPDGRVCAVRISAVSQHGPDHSRRWGSAVVTSQCSRSDPGVGSEPADGTGAHRLGTSPPEFLAVRPLRVDLRHDRHHRASARGHRRVWRAVLLRFTAGTGNRRAASRLGPAIIRSCARGRTGSLIGGNWHRHRLCRLQVRPCPPRVRFFSRSVRSIR